MKDPINTISSCCHWFSNEISRLFTACKKGKNSDHSIDPEEEEEIKTSSQYQAFPRSGSSSLNVVNDRVVYSSSSRSPLLGRQKTKSEIAAYYAVEFSKIVCSAIIKAPLLSLTTFQLFEQHLLQQKDADPAAELSESNELWKLPLILFLVYIPQVFTKYLQTHLKSDHDPKYKNSLANLFIKYSAFIFFVTDVIFNVKAFDDGMVHLIKDQQKQMITRIFGHVLFSIPMSLQSLLFSLDIAISYCENNSVCLSTAQEKLKAMMYSCHSLPMWTAALGRSMASAISIWGIEESPGVWVSDFSTPIKISASIVTLMGIKPKKQNYVLSADNKAIDSSLPKICQIPTSICSTLGYTLGDGLLTSASSAKLGLPKQMSNFVFAGSMLFGSAAYLTKLIKVDQDQEIKSRSSFSVSRV